MTQARAFDTFQAAFRDLGISFTVSTPGEELR